MAADLEYVPDFFRFSDTQREKWNLSQKEFFKYIVNQLALTMNSSPQPYTNLAKLAADFNNDWGFPASVVANRFGRTTFENFISSDEMKKYVYIDIDYNGVHKYLARPSSVKRLDEDTIGHIRHNMEVGHMHSAQRAAREEREKYARAMLPRNRERVLEGRRILTRLAYQMGAETELIPYTRLREAYEVEFGRPLDAEEKRKYFMRDKTSKILEEFFNNEFELHTQEQTNAIFIKLRRPYEEIEKEHEQLYEAHRKVPPQAIGFDTRRTAHRAPKAEPFGDRQLLRVIPTLPPILEGEDVDSVRNTETTGNSKVCNQRIQERASSVTPAQLSNISRAQSVFEIPCTSNIKRSSSTYNVEINHTTQSGLIKTDRNAKFMDETRRATPINNSIRRNQFVSMSNIPSTSTADHNTNTASDQIFLSGSLKKQNVLTPSSSDDEDEDIKKGNNKLVTENPPNKTNEAHVGEIINIDPFDDPFEDEPGPTLVSRSKLNYANDAFHSNAVAQNRTRGPSKCSTMRGAASVMNMHSNSVFNDHGTSKQLSNGFSNHLLRSASSLDMRAPRVDVNVETNIPSASTMSVNTIAGRRSRHVTPHKVQLLAKMVNVIMSYRYPESLELTSMLKIIHSLDSEYEQVFQGENPMDFIHRNCTGVTISVFREEVCYP
ncbi:hypothetical protein Ddc_06014 [Ditylenchus destructor]|nr:hypothetical protein Ddc_06014 [Ditylenchus destructor]